MNELNEYEAALRFGFSPELLRWFTVNPVIDAKTLSFREANRLYYFNIEDLKRFDKKLEGKWPLPTTGKRPTIPVGIKRDIKMEAQNRCPVCNTNQGEVAHIHAVAKSHCNHPKNLLYLCPNHHTQYDFGFKTNPEIMDDVLRWKVVLRRFRESIWQVQGDIIRTYLGALNSALSLVTIQEELSKKIPDSEFKRVLESISEASKKVGGKEIRDTNLSDLKKKIRDNTDSENESACPLCNGTGSTSVFDRCPVCYGNGEIEEDPKSIDLTSFKPITCKLCGGSGIRDGRDCPACKGIGEVPRGFSDDHDWSQYKMVKCRLCDGIGNRDGNDCPVCHGDCQVEKGFSEEHDWSQYEMVKCRLCDGSGRRDRNDCPVCHGDCQVEKGFSEEHDWSQYEMVGCRLCKGSGSRDGNDCPVCHGDCQVEKGFSETFDWAQFSSVNCKLCKGSGSRDGDDCPVCNGQGQVSRAFSDNCDWSQYK